MKEGQNRLLEVFQREKDRFMAFARGKIRGLASADPEDIVAEVFNTLLDKGDLVGETENLVAYIYRALGNRILDFRRREARTPSAGAPDVDQLADPGSDPHAAFQARQTRERLTRALDTLGAKERAVWLATEVEGRNFRDLAALWGEPLGTLLSRKSRATATLRLQLADLNHTRS
jgi:RNA polymerase sigma factor (sigma-70 family)